MFQGELLYILASKLLYEAAAKIGKGENARTLFYMKNLFSVENIDKAVLSIIAWFVYIVLLWGHYHEGWRGRRVVWFEPDHAATAPAFMIMAP